MIKKFEEFIVEGKRKTLLKENANVKNPSVYVGTYGKYNEGSLDGEWVDITEFDTYEDFIDYCRKLHGDENSAELMFQDYAGFPEIWYSESGMSEETFDKIKEFSELDSDKKGAYEAYLTICDEGNDSIDEFENCYQGYYNSPEDFAEEYFTTNNDIPDFIIDYIDWNAVWRDLNISDGYEYVNGYVFSMN